MAKKRNMPVSGGVRPGENRELAWDMGAKIGNKEIRDREVEACTKLLKVPYESKLNASDIKQLMREKKLTDVSGADIS